ncbi:hypothetical protein GCM10027275_55460 [Rhabdobacter roseus]|uniref:Outer membrane protein OmpA-like peptidoglycan-associated protein n=1 Tax=Rhabdobacter roseus TaxID=1655419 RepID=A0A840U1T6_9BACT|nr:OmpA family protein [Rhabdobacter roseus]MBB5287553.1 outer membrane protein OmpA-like peptidoglycan-associated protein [Rhabdobacter roseus]
MKTSFTLFALVWVGLAGAWGQVTPRPRVDEQSAPYVKITRVELTKSYTIIDMRFVNSSLPRELLPFSRNQGGVIPISINPDSRLYEPGVTSRKFAFVRAENIPPSPESRRVYPGDTVQFRLYYERLEPGIEVFDFYEGRSAQGYNTWNFYGIHIKNPKQPTASTQARKSTPKEAPAQPPAAEVPAPEVPTPTSRTVTWLGTVYDAQTKKPIAAQLSYVEAGDTLQVRTSSGKYRLGLAEGQAAVQVSAKGYLGTSGVLNSAEAADPTSLTQDFYLVPLAAGASFTLENIYFATGEFMLLSESHRELDQLVETMRSNPTLRIRVEGHTDNLGDFDKNLELSRQRAESVKNYLVKQGIPAARIDTQGYGSTRPATKGTSEAERQKNRRVEVVVIET